VVLGLACTERGAEGAVTGGADVDTDSRAAAPTPAVLTPWTYSPYVVEGLSPVNVYERALAGSRISNPDRDSR
jgi:hypothetical protein